MTFFVSSVPVDQTLNENGSRIKAWFPGVDWNPSSNAVRASVILLSRHIRSTPWGRGGHSTSIITIESVIILLTVPILITPVPTSLIPRGQSWAVGRLDYICSDGSAVDPISRLRYS